MATMTEIPAEVSTQIPTEHDYHAEAHVLRGHLRRPIEQNIEPQVPIVLRDRRGGHLTRFNEEVSIEGLITYAKGKTRVSGSRSLKHNGWVTLSTSIMEGMNVFEILTADRVVSQVSTDHPYVDGHIPRVTFLGTQFTNLSLSGFPITLNLNLGICGPKPANDRSYLQDANFLNAVKTQTSNIMNAKGLPNDLKARYAERLANVERLLGAVNSAEPRRDEPSVICSLVESINPIPIPGVTSFGNVLVVPEFGTVSFAEVTVGERMYPDSTRPDVYFELTGVTMDLGCVGHGSASAATAAANGHTRP